MCVICFIDTVLLSDYCVQDKLPVDKVRMYEEIMMNNDNLECNLLTSSLLNKMSGLHASTS